MYPKSSFNGITPPCTREIGITPGNCFPNHAVFNFVRNQLPGIRLPNPSHSSLNWVFILSSSKFAALPELLQGPLSWDCRSVCLTTIHKALDLFLVPHRAEKVTQACNPIGGGKIRSLRLLLATESLRLSKKKQEGGSPEGQRTWSCQC